MNKSGIVTTQRLSVYDNLLPTLLTLLQPLSKRVVNFGSHLTTFTACVFSVVMNLSF